MAKHNQIGEEGELEARLFLQKNGYLIRHVNWRYGHYELDIVAETETELVFVEVKTRTSFHFEAPEMAVGKAKIRRIVAAADEYIQLFDTEKPPRFDIISVYKTTECTVIDHIEDAFYAPIM